MEVEPSQGEKPVSLTVNRGVLYVLNSGEATDDLLDSEGQAIPNCTNGTPSITGFKVDDEGRLCPNTGFHPPPQRPGWLGLRSGLLQPHRQRAGRHRADCRGPGRAWAGGRRGRHHHLHPQPGRDAQRAARQPSDRRRAVRLHVQQAGPPPSSSTDRSGQVAAQRPATRCKRMGPSRREARRWPTVEPTPAGS